MHQNGNNFSDSLFSPEVLRDVKPWNVSLQRGRQSEPKGGGMEEKAIMVLGLGCDSNETVRLGKLVLPSA